MLKVFVTLARVGLGFVLASLTAGLVTVLFVNTPSELAAQPASQYTASASDTLDLALLTATHASLFAAAFVLIAAGLGEWFSIRSLPFYLITGSVISLLGFGAQYSSEVSGQPTILNNYAIKAFLTAGFFAGFVYWLASGQFAGTEAPAGGAGEAAETPKAKPVAARKVATLAAPPKRAPADVDRPARDPLANVRAGGAKLMDRLAKAREQVAARAKSSLARASQMRPKKSSPDAGDIKAEARDEKPKVAKADKIEVAKKNNANDA